MGLLALLIGRATLAMVRNSRTRLWLARVLIGIVFAWNAQCAVAFLLAPSAYAPGFELSGVTGEAMVRGLGVLFLMWNVPYAVALWHPSRHRVSLWQAIAMQGIGLVGETTIRWSLPAGQALIRGTLDRFVAFDAAGLVLLVLAAWIAWPRRLAASTSEI